MPDPTSRTPRGPLLRQRLRSGTRDLLRALVPPASAVALAGSDTRSDDAHFRAPVCRNCGAPRDQPHCGACGQGAVGRLSSRDVLVEFWQSRRLFEMTWLHAALRLARAPGQVAREYVLGARKRHMHPLKLLLLAVTALVLLLGRTGYLTAGQTELSGPMQLVANWARWSFSLGLVATLAATWCVLRRRLGYNPVEHLVLAVYVQSVVIAANAINLLPLLALDPARWAGPWRQASAWYMTPLELGVVAVAACQFFRLHWRRDAMRIAAVLGVFHLTKKALLLGYARLIYHAALAPSP